MTPTSLAIITVLALFILSAGADVIFPAADRLPIHWGLNGQPNNMWPRRPALYMLPLTSAALFTFILALGPPPEAALWLLSATQLIVQLILLGSIAVWFKRK
jgi:hypothetical protein